MTLEEEKEFARQFFMTRIGKTVLKKLDDANEKQAEMIRMSKKIQLLESRLAQSNLESEVEDEEDKTLLVDKAISLLHSGKAPQLLFNVVGTDGVNRGYYTNQIEKILAQDLDIESFLKEEQEKQEENI